MGEWYEPEDDPLLQGIPTDWSLPLAVIALVCVLIGAAVRWLWAWLF